MQPNSILRESIFPSALFQACAVCDGDPVEGGYVINGVFFPEEDAPLCPEHEAG